MEQRCVENLARMERRGEVQFSEGYDKGGLRHQFSEKKEKDEEKGQEYDKYENQKKNEDNFTAEATSVSAEPAITVLLIAMVRIL